jgi:hypothetical protein
VGTVPAGDGGEPPEADLTMPVHVRGRVFGHLRLTPHPGGQPFTVEDEHLTAGLTAGAGAAIGHAGRHRPPRMPADEDDHVDEVLQRLFATGLGLQRSVGLVHQDPQAAQVHIERAIDDLDETVRAIRADRGDTGDGSRPRRDLRP